MSAIMMAFRPAVQVALRFCRSPWALLALFLGGAVLIRCIVAALPSAMPTCERIKDNRGQISGLCFAPDGRSLVTSAADGVIRIYDVTGRFMKRQIRNTPDAVSSLTLS